MKEKFKALIVDDEPLARRSIRKFLRPFPEFEISAECGDGRSAVAAIRENVPDLVFLDVQMPELTGLELMEEIGPANMPVTIFVTAYDRYALQAFEAHAVDYLVKPFSEERFQDALRHAKRVLEAGRNRIPDEKLVQLLEQLKRQKDYPERISVPSKGRFIFLTVRDVEWIEGEGNYLRLHTAGSSYLVRGNMTEMEKKLDPGLFIRIHRSTIVNLQRVREVQPWFRGHHLVIMKNGQQLRLSRYQKDKLRTLLGKG